MAFAHSQEPVLGKVQVAALFTVIFKNLCQQEGVTIIMTTHDTGLMEIGDRVYELEDGEIIDGE